jgi:DNA-binding GntR family transcriptional regulator
VSYQHSSKKTDLPVASPLPSVKQLQEEYAVGRDTALRAVEILRTEGVVFTVPRRGTYVSPDAK